MGEDRIQVVNTDPRPCVVVRMATTWTAFPDQWRPMLDEVWAMPRAQPQVAHGHNVMIYRDPDADLHDVDVVVEVGVEVGGDVAVGGRVMASTLPSGRAATTTHSGGPASLGAAYEALIAWCDQHDQTRISTRWEVYGHPDATGAYDIK